MIEASRVAISQMMHWRRWTAAALATLLLFIGACVSNDDDKDGQPVLPSTEPSIVATSLPSTATETAPVPSATAFTRPTSVIVPTSSVGEVPPPAIDAVIARAGEEYEVNATSVRIITFKQQTWPSTALGCPEPGRSYAQIVISGYIVMLNVDGTAVTYHADESGAAIVRCDLSPNIAP